MPLQIAIADTALTLGMIHVVVGEGLLDRQFALAHSCAPLLVRQDDGRTYFDLRLRDAWVWDMYRHTRFVADVHVASFKDVNIEELPGKEL